MQDKDENFFAGAIDAICSEVKNLNEAQHKSTQDIVYLHERLAMLAQETKALADGMIELAKLFKELGQKHNRLVKTVEDEFNKRK